MDDLLAGSIMLAPPVDVTSDFTAPSIEGSLDFMDLTPGGDFLAGSEAIKNQDMLGLALAALSLGVPGTIRAIGPRNAYLDPILTAPRPRVVEPVVQVMDDAAQISINPDTRAFIDSLLAEAPYQVDPLLPIK
jgi:hypothetical protein